MLILAYHRVNPEVRDGLSVSADTLRQNIQWLLDRGWSNFVVDEWANGDAEVGSRSFAITFDDGYQDNIIHAAPVLEDLGVRATVYLVSSMIDVSEPFPWLEPGPEGFDALDFHMTTSQLEQGLESGTFVYGSHTQTHPLLSSIPIEQAASEIRLSKSELESALGIAIHTFCYPAGDFNTEVQDLVESTGYRAAVVTPNRIIPETPFSLHRVGIYSHITPRLFAVKTARLTRTAQTSKMFWSLRRTWGRLSR